MTIEPNAYRSPIPKGPWILVLATVVVFFISNAFVAYRSMDVMRKNSNSIDNTLQIINLIRELQVQLYAAESGQRGYLITKDRQYLDPYYASVNQIHSLLAELSKTTTELPRQQNRFALLQVQMSEKIDIIDKTIAHVEQDQNRAAVKLVNTDRGLELTQSILLLLLEMDIDEHNLLKENRIKSKKNSQNLTIVLIFTNFLGLGLALVVYYISLKFTRKNRELYDQIEQTNRDLELKVIERTETLSRYANELERSNRELEDFAFVASHDLQEPLRKIRAFGDRLSSRFGDILGEQGNDYVKRMHAASQRMSRLIDDLLSYSRVTTRQRTFEQVDLNNIISQVKEDLEIAIEEKSAIITKEPIPIIQGDGSQLGQVFSNLISNSLKFVKQNTQPDIVIACAGFCDLSSAHGEWIRITLTDNGIGFEPQYSERIFNLFQRLHGRDEYTGTGIGLALCRKIVEQHGGTIKAESKPDMGTTFIIDLPLNPINLYKSDIE